MEQTKALNALEPFLALTKSASSPRAAVDLITRATSAPNTFVFAELLSTPQIQALSSSPEYASHLTLLKIFSYGTYTDYTSSSLPALSPQQTTKLRQLSFLTLARKPENLTYTKLLSALGLSTQRELEDLVISAIYAGLIEGTLDPCHQRVAVSSVSPLRDLEPDSIPAMLSTLQEWSARCTSTLGDLERQIAGVRAAALKRRKEEKEWNEAVEKMLEKGEKEKDGGKGKGKEEGGSQLGEGMFAGVGRKLGLGAGVASKRAAGSAMDGGDEDEGEMDLDEDEEQDGGNTRSTRSSKKRGIGRSS